MRKRKFKETQIHTNTNHVHRETYEQILLKQTLSVSKANDHHKTIRCMKLNKVRHNHSSQNDKAYVYIDIIHTHTHTNLRNKRLFLVFVSYTISLGLDHYLVIYTCARENKP